MRMAALLMLLAVNLQMLHSLYKLPRQPVPGDSGTVILTKKLLYWGLAIALIAEIPAIILFIMDIRPKTVLNLSILSLFGAVLMRLYTSSRIYFDDEGFRKLYFLGCSRYFRYEELTGIHGKDFDVKLYAGKNVIRVSSLADRYRFLLIAKRNCRHAHGGKDIPKMKDFDIFRGNFVKPGWRSILLTVLILIPICLELIGIIEYFTMKPVPFEELEPAKGPVYNLEDLHDGIYFQINNRKEHFHFYLNALKDPETAFEYLRSGGIVELGSIRHVDHVPDRYPSSYREHYNVLFLKSSDGRVFYTPEDALEYRKFLMRRFNIFEFTSIFIWEGICVLFLLVGRYPNRFPIKLVSFLYNYESFTEECRKKCNFKKYKF